jgi:hypothetical protein
MTAAGDRASAHLGPSHTGTCVRCGAPLPRLARRKEPVCRVCATRAAQSFLRNALINRRRHLAPLDGTSDG